MKSKHRSAWHYVAELSRETVTKYIIILGLGSTAATYLPILQQQPGAKLLRGLAALSVAGALLWATFSVYRKKCEALDGAERDLKASEAAREKMQGDLDTRRQDLQGSLRDLLDELNHNQQILNNAPMNASRQLFDDAWQRTAGLDMGISPDLKARIAEFYRCVSVVKQAPRQVTREQILFGDPDLTVRSSQQLRASELLPQVLAELRLLLG
jgi:hypothetical protein